MRSNLKSRLYIRISFVKSVPLCKLLNHPIRNIIRNSLGLQRLCNAGVRVKDMFDVVIVEQKLLLSYENGVAYIQLLVPKSIIGERVLSYPIIRSQHLRFYYFSTPFVVWGSGGGERGCRYLSHTTQEY